MWIPSRQRRRVLTRRQVLAGAGAVALTVATRSQIVPSAQATTVGSAATFPRIAVNFIGGSHNYAHNQTALIDYLSHMDVAIIAADWEGSAASYGYNRGTLVNGINAGDGVVSPVVMQYNTCDRIGAPGGSGLGAPSSTTTPIWWRQFDAMVSPWSVWESGDSGTHVSSGYYRGNAYAWLTNPCDLGARSKDANGNAMYAAFARYVHDYYFAGSTADAAPNLGGVFIDNFSTPVAAPVGDYLQDGSPAAPTDISVYPSLVAGLAEGVQSWRTNAPGKLFCGNTGWMTYVSDDSRLRIFERPYGVIGAHATTARMDFQEFEGFIGETYCMENWSGLARCALYMAYNAGMVNRPELNLAGNDALDSNGGCPGCTSSVGAGVRYWLASAWILDNGCPSYLSRRTVSGGYYLSLDWFDWLSVNPATGVCLSYASSTRAQIGQYRNWMGTAIDPPQTAPTRLVSFTGGPNVFARRFRTPNNRIALVIANESTNYHKDNTSAVVTLPPVTGGWLALRASSSNYGANSAIDSGATGLTSVTIATGDARILLH
jgi:hypothetical protein